MADYNFQPKPNTELWGDHREVQTWEASKLFGKSGRYLRASVVENNDIFGESVERDFRNSNELQFTPTVANGYTEQVITTVVGDLHTVTFIGKQGSAGASISIVDVVSDIELISSSTVGTDYETISFTFAPTGTTTSVRLKIDGVGTGMNSLFQKVSVLDLASTELILNGKFIDGQENWTDVDGTSLLIYNAIKIYFSRDDDTVYEGGENFGGFGFLPSYQDLKYVPVKWFKDANIEPIEGDLIYDDMYKLLFEITKVDALNETFGADRINDRLFNYKIYLKQYQRADDNFEDFENTEWDAIEELDSSTLDNLNDSLQQTIEDEDVKSVDINNPFGLLDN